MSKRLVGGIIGCKDKTSSWHLHGYASVYAFVQSSKRPIDPSTRNPGTSRSAGVGGSGLAIAVGSGWQTGIYTQTKGRNQPTGYYDQAPAINWDLAVSWGRGVWVSVSDSVRVGLANRN